MSSDPIEVTIDLREILSMLTEEEQTVVIASAGLAGKYTQLEISELTGKSRVTNWRIKKRAIAKLRSHLERNQNPSE